MTCDPSSAMTRAWRLFRLHYGYEVGGKRIPFRSVGRHCFAACLKQAEIREEARIAAIPVAIKLARIEEIEAELAGLEWMANWRQASSNPSAAQCRAAAPRGLRRRK